MNLVPHPPLVERLRYVKRQPRREAGGSARDEITPRREGATPNMPPPRSNNECSDDAAAAAAATASTGAGELRTTGSPLTSVPAVPVGTVWAVVNATVPGGSTGEVHVPLLSPTNGTITESGAVVWQAGAFIPGSSPGVRGGGSDGRFAWFFTQSGNYSFQAAV